MTHDALKALLAGMTLEEKAGQLIQCNAGQFISTDAEITGPEGKALPAEELNRVMGSVLTFENARQAKQLQDMHLAADRNRIPLLLMVDVIHGMKTTYPIPLAMGCSFDDGLMAECAGMARREAAAAGVHVTFNPMVDTARDARWGRILETCSEEPLINSRMGAAFVRETQGKDLRDPENIACCVKHYAAYGAGEAGRDYNTVELSERILRESYLPAYKACIDAGARLVMPSFNALNGIPSVANKWLMNTVLRGEWGFSGVVISDYDAVGELVTHGVAEDLKDAVRLAMEAGCDIDMVKCAYFLYLADLVREGRVPEQAVDDAVMRVLELKNELGLFENPYHGADEEAEKKLNLCPAHRETARRAAEESAVLLKNDGVLPLSKTIRKLALSPGLRSGTGGDRHQRDQSSCGSGESRGSGRALPGRAGERQRRGPEQDRGYAAGTAAGACPRGGPGQPEYRGARIQRQAAGLYGTGGNRPRDPGNVVSRHGSRACRGAAALGRRQSLRKAFGRPAADDRAVSDALQPDQHRPAEAAA